jgi:D-serine deaminase-like pyridoxal phosphate-dependent protein
MTLGVKRIREAETPALLLDSRKLDANCARMLAHINARGVAFRPHVKTAKSMDVVRRACGGVVQAITVSTLDEADYFFQQGVRDILYAVGMSPNKLKRVRALRAAGCDLKVITDSLEAAAMVLGETHSDIPTLIEIDTDGHRSGVEPNSAKLIQIGECLGRNYAGVMTHAGESYHSVSLAAIQAMAEQERAGAVRAADRLNEIGLRARIVSVGSTPTALYGQAAEGLTEVRAGVYMFFDLFMAGLGVCELEDIALSTLTTVIGHQQEKSWLITDSGWTALSSDRATSGQGADQGFGLVHAADGSALMDDLIVRMVNQEHGIVTRRDEGPIAWERYPVGSQLRILPNHACAMAACYGGYLVTGDGETVSARWPRLSGRGAVFA